MDKRGRLDLSDKTKRTINMEIRFYSTVADFYNFILRKFWDKKPEDYTRADLWYDIVEILHRGEISEKTKNRSDLD